jgi:GxxExxY protein
MLCCPRRSPESAAVPFAAYWPQMNTDRHGCSHDCRPFLEKVDENALAHELRKAGLSMQQHAMVVRYDGVVVGEYVADLLVESLVLVELKHARVIDDVHMAQCLNYLKATGLQLCLLLNFGEPRVEIRRISL